MAADIFHEDWGHTTRGRWTTDDLAVWRNRAAWIRAEFKRDLRRANVFGARVEAMLVDGKIGS